MNFQNQLVNPQTLTEWIKCAFNGNILELAQTADSKYKARVEQTMYIDALFNSRVETMRLIHKVNYAKIFSDKFQVETLDDKLADLQLDE